MSEENQETRQAVGMSETGHALKQPLETLACLQGIRREFPQILKVPSLLTVERRVEFQKNLP